MTECGHIPKEMTFPGTTTWSHKVWSNPGRKPWQAMVGSGAQSYISLLP